MTQTLPYPTSLIVRTELGIGKKIDVTMPCSQGKSYTTWGFNINIEKRNDLKKIKHVHHKTSKMSNTSIIADLII